MASNHSQRITCPKCGSIALLTLSGNSYYYSCIMPSCDWDSRFNTVDISYNSSASPLSNLFPNSFEMPYSTDISIGYIHCLSMESFLQSLKIKDFELQRIFCRSYNGLEAKKLSETLSDWKEKGILYWGGKEFERNSKEYTSLITKAYDSLFIKNSMFREVFLPKFQGIYLIHSIGSNDPKETVLTQDEFLYQLNRLKLKNIIPKKL